MEKTNNPEYLPVLVNKLKYAEDLYLKWVIESPKTAFENPIYVLYNREQYLEKDHKYHKFLIKWFDEIDIKYIEETFGTRKQHKEHMKKYYEHSETELFKDVLDNKFGGLPDPYALSYNS